MEVGDAVGGRWVMLWVADGWSLHSFFSLLSAFI